VEGEMMEFSDWLMLISLVLSWIVAIYFWNQYRVLSGAVRKIVKDIDAEDKADA
jgi:hypothetical protein